MKRFIKAISIISVLILLTGCAPRKVPYNLAELNAFVDSSEYKYAKTATMTSLEGYEDYLYAAESDSIALFYKKDGNAIAVLQKSNGKVWCSAKLPETLEKKPNPLYEVYMQALFVINYSDLNLNQGNPSRSIYKMEKKRNVLSDIHLSPKKVDGGFEVAVEDKDLDIKFLIQFFVNGGDLVVRIPADSIKEGQNYGIVNIEVLPFFGNAETRQEGFVLMPDGCGTVSDYKYLADECNSMTKDLHVFAQEKVSFYQYNTDLSTGVYYASMPVFGVSQGDNGFIAFSTGGDADKQINLTASGYGVDLHRSYMRVVYRHYFEIQKSNINVGGNDIMKNNVAYRAQRNINRTNHEITYRFLTEGTSYSAMANEYRKYLTDNELVNQVDMQTKDLPVVVDFFMGIVESGAVVDKYVKMTTYEQIDEIVEELNRAGANNLIIKLRGWENGGFGKKPATFPPDSRLGGTSKLEDLSKKLKAKGISIYLVNDFLFVNKDESGFSASRDVVKQGDTNPVSSWNGTMILNNTAVYNKVTDFTKKVSKVDGLGVAFEGITDKVYHDLNKKALTTRQETTDVFSEVIRETKEKGIDVAVFGSNLYGLKYADCSYNLPYRSSKTITVTKDIPFLQMVLHGLIPYTSSLRGNLYYDPVLQKLQALEYGYTPGYELTYQESVLLKFTGYNDLFTSQYKDWIEDISEVYKIINGELKGAYSSQMMEHNKISPTLVSIKYSNNDTLYINYAETEAVYEDITIEAKNYKLVKGAA